MTELPIRTLTFDCDLRAPFAQVTRRIDAVAWPSTAAARCLTFELAHSAACALICSNLRLVAARMSACDETPPMGFQAHTRLGKEQ